jgi:hypothetical protein
VRPPGGKGINGLRSVLYHFDLKPDCPKHALEQLPVLALVLYDQDARGGLPLLQRYYPTPLSGVRTYYFALFGQLYRDLYVKLGAAPPDAFELNGSA